MKRSLYICYFGLRQPLVRTQVIPYLQELARGGIDVSLLTFEPEMSSEWTPEAIETERINLAEKGIKWDLRAYHKRPSALATAWDILVGSLTVRKKIAADKIDILHGRVHVATLMGALARKFSSRKPKLIFDIRGFFPEEYTDAGVWPANGLLYRSAKGIERWLMKESDGFVVLTEKAREMILVDETRPVEVIPCCVDFAERFPADIGSRRDEMREKLGVAGRTVYTHVGALGGLYLTEELADLMAEARGLDQRAFAMFLTQSDPTEIVELLKARGFKDADMFVGRVDPAEIPTYLSASDVGLSFVKATYATQSRSPTKIPEYLAAGLPIIANSGVGDVDELINTEKVGLLIDKFEPEAYQNVLFRLRRLGNVSERCKEVARRRFDLETVGGVRYRRLYDNILQS
ncbi:MAG: glycosyltransferase family 4 protein [Pyrinomonadaceae bacterium]|nr:glycosyltransferase family 4 protein [Pyrinomonadaceae bacterium]